jgi:hypothetical protein
MNIKRKFLLSTFGEVKAFSYVTVVYFSQVVKLGFIIIIIMIMIPSFDGVVTLQKDRHDFRIKKRTDTTSE